MGRAPPRAERAPPGWRRKGSARECDLGTWQGGRRCEEQSATNRGIAGATLPAWLSSVAVDWSRAIWASISRILSRIASTSVDRSLSSGSRVCSTTLRLRGRATAASSGLPDAPAGSAASPCEDDKALGVAADCSSSRALASNVSERKAAALCGSVSAGLKVLALRNTRRTSAMNSAGLRYSFASIFSLMVPKSIGC